MYKRPCCFQLYADKCMPSAGRAIKWGKLFVQRQQQYNVFSTILASLLFYGSFLLMKWNENVMGQDKRVFYSYANQSRSSDKPDMFIKNESCKSEKHQINNNNKQLIKGVSKAGKLWQEEWRRTLIPIR